VLARYGAPTVLENGVPGTSVDRLRNLRAEISELHATSASRKIVAIAIPRADEFVESCDESASVQSFAGGFMDLDHTA